MVPQSLPCSIDTYAMNSSALSEAKVTTSFWKMGGRFLMPRVAQLWLALVYAYHIVRVSSEMLFYSGGPAPVAILPVHVSQLTCSSTGMLPLIKPWSIRSRS